MEDKTIDRIKYISFKLFLERGFEATNIRDICKEVGIKPSSLYFYYKSKEELFFSLYDEICLSHMKYIQDIKELGENISPKIKLYTLFKKKIEYYTGNIANQKFMFRYHLFPPEEISSELSEKYKFWSVKENQIILEIIRQCLERKIFDNKRDINYYFMEYRDFEKFQTLKMIINSIKMSDNELDQAWTKFWVGLINH